MQRSKSTSVDSSPKTEAILASQSSTCATLTSMNAPTTAEATKMIEAGRKSPGVADAMRLYGAAIKRVDAIRPRQIQMLATASTNRVVK